MRHTVSIFASAALILAAAPSPAPAAPSQPASAGTTGSLGDPMVAKALGRIAKVEAAEKALAAGDKKKAATLLNQLGWATKRLNAVVQQNTAEWKAAMEKHNALLKKLEAKRDATPTPAPAPKPGAGSGSGSGSGGGTPPPAPAPAPAKYNPAELKALNQRVSNSFQSVQSIPLRLFLDGNRVNGLRREVKTYREKIAAFPAADANVKIVTGNIDLFEGVVTKNLAQIEADRKTAPEIEARLDKIFDKYDDTNFPLRIERPYRESQVRAFAAEVRQRREVKIPADVAWLQTVADNVVVKRHRVSSVMGMLTGTQTRKLDEAVNFVTSGIDGVIDHGIMFGDTLLKVSPEDSHEMLLYVLGNGAIEKTLSRVEEALDAVKLGRILDAELRREGGANRDAQEAKLELVMGHVKELGQLGLGEMRMPEPQSTDPDLIKVATELLQEQDVKKEWEIGEPLRTVISYDKTSHERREAWISSESATTAKVQYYNYKWDEFGVTTAEEVGDKVFLYYHRLKRYESGDERTTLNKWLVTSRIELSQILRENVEK